MVLSKNLLQCLKLVVGKASTTSLKNLECLIDFDGWWIYRGCIRCS